MPNTDSQTDTHVCLLKNIYTSIHKYIQDTYIYLIHFSFIVLELAILTIFEFEILLEFLVSYTSGNTEF